LEQLHEIIRPDFETKVPVQSLEMPIDDVRTITGRGTLVKGKIRRGVVKTGDSVTITGPGGKSTSSVVTGVEMSRRLVGSARAGDTVGVLLRGSGLRTSPRVTSSGQVDLRWARCPSSG